MATLRTWAGDAAMGEGERTDLSALFHRLNNQLGIVLANAELLESRMDDEQGRTRAAHVIAAALDAMTTARDLRSLVDHDEPL